MNRLNVVLLLFVCTVVAGCSKPPAEEEKRAVDALAMAREAEAPVYAAAAFTMAQDTLDAAISERERQDEKFRLFRSYGKARQGFTRAELLANRSAEQAVGQKKRRADEARETLALAAAMVDSCAALLDLAPKAKGTRADLKLLRADLAALGATLGEANIDLENRRWDECTRRAQSVIDTADSLKVQITAAIEKKKR